jgi:hypothetical protein
MSKRRNIKEERQDGDWGKEQEERERYNRGGKIEVTAGEVDQVWPKCSPRGKYFWASVTWIVSVMQLNLSKAKPNLLYKRSQSVPRCKHFPPRLYSAFGNSLCTYKRCWKCCQRVSIQAWTRLILFANTFCRSAFGKSLCTYNSCWKWCQRASIQAWTRLILFANTFCRSAFGKSLCTYKRCWKWCQRASIQAWTRLILFANTFCRSAFGKSLCTYKMCWRWCSRASIKFFSKLLLH